MDLCIIQAQLCMEASITVLFMSDSSAVSVCVAIYNYSYVTNIVVKDL